LPIPNRSKNTRTRTHSGPLVLPKHNGLLFQVEISPACC